MGILPIRTWGDPVLRERGRDVEDFDASLRTLADDMLETMYQAPGVGLAAQQVGLPLRLFVYDPGDETGPGVLVNPVLSEAEGEQDGDEGCLSIPSLYYPTRRALRIRVSGRDLDGNPISIVGEGLLARIFQHETDHTNGMLFVERLDDQERRRAMGDIRALDLDGRPRMPQGRS